MLHHAPNAAVTKALIKAGANVNSQDLEGRTAITKAKDVGTIKALIKAGAEVNFKNDKTALHFADNAEAIKALIKLGLKC